ncbi:MAG: hypothetical protein WC229_01175 [Candidatus Paceibacterota bacterium]|jgi:hypothetical protein
MKENFINTAEGVIGQEDAGEIEDVGNESLESSTIKPIKETAVEIPQIKWEDEREVAKINAADKFEAQVRLLGIKEFNRLGLDQGSLSVEDYEDKLKRLGSDILIKRNVEEADKKEQAIKKEMEEARKQREFKKQLDEINRRPINRIKNFLSRDLLGFLKKKK